MSFAPLAFNLLRVQHTPYDGAVPAAAAAQRTAAVATLRIAAVHRVVARVVAAAGSPMEICESAGFRGGLPHASAFPYHHVGRRANAI